MALSGERYLMITSDNDFFSEIRLRVTDDWFLVVFPLAVM